MTKSIAETLGMASFRRGPHPASRVQLGELGAEGVDGVVCNAVVVVHHLDEARSKWSNLTLFSGVEGEIGNLQTVTFEIFGCDPLMLSVMDPQHSLSPCLSVFSLHDDAK